MRGSTDSNRHLADLIDTEMFPGSLESDKAAEVLHYGICSLSAVSEPGHYSKMISRAREYQEHDVAKEQHRTYVLCSVLCQNLS